MSNFVVSTQNIVYAFVGDPCDSLDVSCHKCLVELLVEEAGGITVSCLICLRNFLPIGGVLVVVTREPSQMEYA